MTDEEIEENWSFWKNQISSFPLDLRISMLSFLNIIHVGYQKSYSLEKNKLYGYIESYFSFSYFWLEASFLNKLCKLVSGTFGNTESSRSTLRPNMFIGVFLLYKEGLKSKDLSLGEIDVLQDLSENLGFGRPRYMGSWAIRKVR